jgi:hypothetical protein
MEEVLQEANGSDAGGRALEEAEWTCYGTAVREKCLCWFYERAPWTHDGFLDLPDLPPAVGWSLILRLTFLDGNRSSFHTDTEECLFLVPEEIGTFVNIHNMAVGGIVQEMTRLDEQARWGRFSGRKMAIVHDVPGLDSEYV